MIDKKELRVGNIYNRKHGKGWTQTVIDETIMGKIFTDSPEYALNDFEDIPLTGGLLELCGCRLQAMRQSIYVIGRLKIWLGHTGILCYLKNEDDNGSCYIPNGGIRFLHQFQNLYYSLTGTELTINL